MVNALILLALAVLTGAELMPGRVADAVQITVSIACLLVGVWMLVTGFRGKPAA